MRKRRLGPLLMGLILGIALGWWLAARRRRWAAIHPPEDVPSEEPAKHTGRRALSALAVLLVTLAILMGLLLGLTQTSWSISRGMRLKPDTLEQLREVRDELAAEGVSPAAVEWLDQALHYPFDGTDVFYYAKAALQVLEATGEGPKVQGYSYRLRRIIAALKGGRGLISPRPTPSRSPLSITPR
jgi:uncharacterized protein YneF (UPF0154 family)